MARLGRVVILNGAPRSGKSTLARAVQEQVEGQWINWGVDAFNRTLPPRLMPGIGLRPGGERPDFEPEVFRLFGLYAQTLVQMARSGLDVVADLGLHADYATAIDPMDQLQGALGGMPRLLVGVHCDLDIIMARRNADPQGGFYVAGPGIPAPVRRWQEAVHAGKSYDLELDMGVLTPAEGAEQVGRALASLVTA